MDNGIKGILGGTAGSWKRLIEELARQKCGRFVVTIDGRAPTSVSRITQPYHLQDREEREDSNE